MNFINTKILLAILAAVTVIAGVAVSWETQNQEDLARMEASETKKQNGTAPWKPDPDNAKPITADDL